MSIWNDSWIPSFRDLRQVEGEMPREDEAKVKTLIDSNNGWWDM